MKFKEVLKTVKDNNCAAVAINYQSKEIFIIEYDNDPERYSEIIVWYLKDLGESAEVEENYTPEEFLKEFPEATNWDFKLIKKEMLEVLDYNFEY